MKEEKFLSIIKSITGEKYIGDDCAYISELGLLVTQDNLVEGVHFSLDYMSAYQLGYKSAMVNISDIAASGGVPKYAVIGLSVPKDTTEFFIEEFYKGLTDAFAGVEVVGGDITGADKIMVSVTIIGVKADCRISSRSNAKTGQVVVSSGVHGSSAAGLKMLLSGNKLNEDLISAHIMPKAQLEYAQVISKNIKEDYAMMDSSDGLADALFKIAQSSGKSIVVDFSKVQYDKVLENLYPDDYKKMVLYGGEDYQIVATVPFDFAQKYGFNIIGEVIDRGENPVIITNCGKSEVMISDLENCYDHFE